MNVYILRHGLAADWGTAGGNIDFERSLTEKGERKTGQVAEAMRCLDLCFDVVLTSPYLRARQTAEIVCEVFGIRNRLVLCEALAPGGKANKLIEVIKALHPEPDNLLLVGHEPDLSNLISLLVFGDPGDFITLKKAGLCKLAAAGGLQSARCATLEWLLTPKQLRSIRP